ncbi:glycosyltransferase [Aridibaculum aurantiacum]|uniref:glycosyltransferase n=1 Tax=Aridibaculum aurantiacum TaxID=2810307 RepID=UPI001A96D7C4|nr:glycosyltransferase [Aridibaculum aurantiacum]
MILGIITDCTHYTSPSGEVCTENHILLRQFKHLSAYFEKTIILCPFGKFDDRKVTTTYTSSNIQFHQLPLVGGNAMKDKVQLLVTVPKWLRAFKMLHRQCDVVYQRFPNNLNIPGFIYFWLQRKKVFATYTGTWSGYQGEAASYRLQRWILRSPFRGPVWVYDEKGKEQGRIRNGFSPSYSVAEWEEETAQVEKRKQRIENGLTTYKFLTVGTIIDYKNQLAIVQACHVLKQKGFSFQLTIVGDGPMKAELEEYVIKNGLQEEVKLVGKQNHVSLRQLYREHDFVVQAPLKEGFGKVPIEGFFHGVIPVINNISMASQMIGANERGFLFDASKPNHLVETLLSLPAQQHLFAGMINKGRTYAKLQTLEAWAREYYETVSAYYNEA